ncbi:MAG TPA: hypothetical protein VLL75_07390 [Vicinamibacteria bacterium]|nr:hypothetical protein [Vicinamibacteria bacterium]
MLIRLAALGLLLVVIFQILRLAMGLRLAKRARERARAEEEARGARVLAEIPLTDAEVVFLVEEPEAFRWGGARVSKDAVRGARLLVNGAVLQEFALAGTRLPAPDAPEEYEGRERWEVRVYLDGGRSAVIPCGTLREGVSREIAGRVFEALQAAARTPQPPPARP